MSDEIKPCPFCCVELKESTSHGVTHYRHDYSNDSTCLMEGTLLWDDRDVKQWNRRAPPAELVEAWGKYKANKYRMTQPMFDVLQAVKKICEVGK